MAGRNAPLLQRGGRQTGVADHIARGIDMWHRCLIAFAINLYSAAMIGLKAHAVKVQAFSGPKTASGKQQHFRAYVPTIV